MSGLLLTRPIPAPLLNQHSTSSLFHNLSPQSSSTTSSIPNHKSFNEKLRLGDDSQNSSNTATTSHTSSANTMATDQSTSVAQIAQAATQQAAQQQQQQQAQQQHATSTSQQQQLPSGLNTTVAGLIAGLTAAAKDGQGCQWDSCTERFPNAEDLYEHICQVHIGRKSTNNLQLVCGWPNCNTTVVKRDHITSHVRVHVPFKPHRCPVCGKSFKRPQDLKKHHKTHADENSAGANGQSQGPNGHSGSNGTNGYGSMNGTGGGSFYGGAGMQTGGGMQFPYNGQQAGGYYHQTAPLPQTYGPMYYNVDTAGGPQLSYRRDDDMNALNNLFGTIKQPNFNSASYPQFSTALTSAHGLILPPPINTHGLDYSSAVETSYPTHLPQLTNVRSKADLLLLQDRLQKMMHAIDAHEHRNQAMAAQVSYEMNRSSLSAASEQTPELTPGTSVMSYSPGHSPPADHSPISSNGVPAYPHLHNNLGMSAVSSLGSQYDHNIAHRYGGGRLQRAQPASAHEPVDEAAGASGKTKKSSDPNIDPSLAGAASASSGSASHSAGSPTPQPESRRGSGSEEQTGVKRDGRIVGDLLSYVKNLLENEQFDKDPLTPASPGNKDAESTKESTQDEMDIDVKEDEQPSYPSLPV